MSEKSDQHTLNSDKTQCPAKMRRIPIYSVSLLVACCLVIAAVAVYRLPDEIQIRRIRSVGGIVTIWSPNSYLYLQSERLLPNSITQSDSFRRLFKPRVRGLDLRHVHDPDSTRMALNAASRFPTITSMTLYQSGVTDADVAMIAHHFPALTNLKLNETAITDRAIAHIASLRCLRALNIQRTSITDAAIEDLLAIPRLKELSVGETKITEFGRLRKSCYVTHQVVTRARTADYYRIHGQ